MKLEIERMNHTGEGIGINNNIIYFIPKVVPGDIIEVEEKDIIHHKNYNQITDYKIIKKSKKRVEIKCPYYKDCGGCQLLQMVYEDQLNYKKEKVKDIFKKYNHQDINPEIIPSPQYHYRNKITLQVKEGVLGLYSEKTNNIIPIENCLLIPENLNKLIPLLKTLNLTKTNKIILKDIKNKIMIQLLGNPDKEEIINKLSNEVSSIYINNDLIKGIAYLKEELSSYQYNISPNSFFQVNHTGTINLYNKAKEYLGINNKEVLDLYCGTGTIGIYLSKNCTNVTGIEINESSVNDAKNNIKINNIKNMKVLKGDVATTLKNDKKYDAIIVDPPRSGLDKTTIKTILKIKASKIIYISCNPMTLSRDINSLKERYNLKKISLIDMFPNTYHVECVSLLILKTHEK